MFTQHTLVFEDSRTLEALDDGSIDLVVTSPPYPMIEMWDELFIKTDPKIEQCLGKGDGRGAFERMHRALDPVWEEVFRVVKDGSFVCVNIGDAVRTLNGRFQLFANHARIQKKFYDLGFDFLPAILWRKQTNAPNKFMGSGLPPENHNADSYILGFVFPPHTSLKKQDGP